MEVYIAILSNDIWIKNLSEQLMTADSSSMEKHARILFISTISAVHLTQTRAPMRQVLSLTDSTNQS